MDSVTDKTEHAPAPRKGRLNSLTFKNGSVHFIDNTGDLPPSLIQANDTIKAGNIRQAAELINSHVTDSIIKIITSDSSRTDLMFLLAVMLRQTKQHDKAKNWLEKILHCEPHPLVYNELALIHQYTGRISDAITCQKKAIRANPQNPEYWANLARMLIEIGQSQQGIDLLQKAVEKMPENASLHSNLLFYLHFLPHLDKQMLFDEHRKWASAHAPESLAAEFHKNSRDSNRRLRIGYISTDFCNHPVACFFEPLLDAHDRRQVEIYGYSNVKFSDTITERLKPKFDHYRDIRQIPDQQVADLIRQDKIDILVELTGHTTDNRLLVLARKPAPIQVTYLGSPDTTGLNTIDYRFTDCRADLPKSSPFYTEELFFLPQSFLCYRPSDFAPPLTPLPARRNGYITFGSFNNLSKIHPHIISLWAQILKKVENSRLVLKFGITADQQISEHLFSLFENHGISRSRIAVCGYRETADHWKLYSEIDIALDTFPFNGYTTACETLWMGLPIISLTGKCHASRVGLSILKAAGLEFFAASTPDQYVAKAVALAQSLESLEKIRASMRQRLNTSPLRDSAAFARSVEKAYRKMWLRWIDSKK